MVKQTNGELVPVHGFDYGQLDNGVAEKVRASADRIRAKVKKCVEDVIDVGNSLLAVKEELEHGHFLLWLKAEFGWSERTAGNFMAVARSFGKSAKFADLAQPSAAYLLAAPAVPDEARKVAVEKAEAGEEITFTIAKGIVAAAKKKGRPGRVSAEKLRSGLVKSLGRFRERCKPAELPEFARQLREFADALENTDGREKTGRQST